MDFFDDAVDDSQLGQDDSEQEPDQPVDDSDAQATEDDAQEDPEAEDGVVDETSQPDGDVAEDAIQQTVAPPGAPVADRAGGGGIKFGTGFSGTTSDGTAVTWGANSDFDIVDSSGSSVNVSSNDVKWD